MHLAIVSPYPPAITGIGQYGYHVSRSLAESDQFTRITVLTGSPGGSALPEVPENVHVKAVWKTEGLDAGWKISAHLRELKPDLVWFNLGASTFGRSPLANLSGFLSPIWGRRLGIPTVITLHELVELTDLSALRAPGGPFARQGARLLTRIALQADVVCLTLQRYVDWLSSRRPKLQCVHIPIGAYHAPEILAESEAQELLFFSLLAPFKGLEVLLEAFRSLRTEYPGLRLTIAGAEHPRFPGYGRQLQKKFGGHTGITWLGEISENNVREIFRRAKIVVLPYMASTGSSSVLFQAATWGRPIIASDLAEIHHALDDSALQVDFFSGGDAASLARSIRALLDAAPRRRAQVEHNFNMIQLAHPEHTCRAYLQAFNLALESRRSSKRLAIPARPLSGLT
jgi:glycosyltransferase involved in cell wall biosynthesis